MEGNAEAAGVADAAKAKVVSKSPWLISLAFGTLFAWWNLYHDEGFLFIDDFPSQVASCVACYGGALVACLILFLARRALAKGTKRWLVGLGIAAMAGGALFYGGVIAGAAAEIIGIQLLLSAIFFVALFFLLRALSAQPLPRVIASIALGIGLYGLLESVLWVISSPIEGAGLRAALHFALTIAAFILIPWALLTAPQTDGAAQPKSTKRESPLSFRASNPQSPTITTSLPEKTSTRLRIPLPLIVHAGAYWFIFGMTHALASGIIPMGHDKLLPCYLGSIAASIVFYLMFGRGENLDKLWPKVRACVFPLTVTSFLLLPFASVGFTFISIGFAQCAMDTYFAFYLLATLSVTRKTELGFTRCALIATLLAVPFVMGGVVTGDALKVLLPLNPLFYNTLSVLAFLLLAAGTFWVGDDRRVELVWGLEKKLTPKRFEDRATTERCAKAVGKFGLTKREGEILLFLAQGQNAAAIAESEVISLNTARTHISRIHRKMNVHNQQELLKCLKEL